LKKIELKMVEIKKIEKNFKKGVKKLFGVIMAAFVAIALIPLTGCGDSGEVIRIFNWGDFMDESIFEDFRAQTGIQVIISYYASNEEMYARISRAGGSGFDLIFPSDYKIEQMISEGLLAPINFDNIPNLRYIDERFFDLPFDPNNRYSVPYKWGTLGILYNTTMVGDTVIDSWDALWDEQFAGNIFMYDSMRDTFAVALKRLGFSLNTTNIDELHAARDSLIEQRPLVRAFVTDDVKNAMIVGEAALAVVYSGDAIFSISQNPQLHYVVPREGSNIWFDSAVIPADARNQAGAEAFINFLNDPQIALRNTLYTGFSTTNRGALELLPDEIRNDPIYWPSDEVYYRSEAFVDLGEFTHAFNRAWTEVLAAQ